MGKHLSLFLLVVLCFSVAALFFPNVEADTSGTLTFSSSNQDGMISRDDDATYAASRNTSTGSVYAAGSANAVVGQLYLDSLYYLDRGFLFFDTSAIPDTATIDSAVLSIYVSANYSTTDFNVTIQKGVTATYPHNPLQTSDYYTELYTGAGGTRSTSDITALDYFNITLSATGEGWISLNGETKLVLRSSNDISNVAPTGAEYLFYYTYEKGSAYAPKLYVTYTVTTANEYSYSFLGPYDEETGLAINENVTVSAWSSEGGIFTQTTFNVSGGLNTTGQVQFFQFTFSDNSTREYWLDESERTTATIYIFKASTTSYVINFLDTTDISDTYPFVVAKRYVNGTLYAVEKRKVDKYKSVLMNLIAGRTYQISLGNEDYSYVFGDLLMTGTTAVQLIVRSVDFPVPNILSQKYVRCYTYRNTTTNPDTIYVTYEDLKQLTASVTVTIKYSDLTTAYTTTLYTQAFTVSWANADTNTTYQVTVTVDHETYGTLTFKQILIKDSGLTAPFSLAFLGNWSFNSSMLLPAFIIIFAAGCFSTLNSEVGAILMCLVAILLTYLGWIPIPIGSLITAITLAILLALINHKRKVSV